VSETTRDAARTGVTFGTAFALVLSWGKWHSFWWAVAHGLLGWCYVVYYFLIANYDKVTP
jgi:hypothetical protein